MRRKRRKRRAVKYPLPNILTLEERQEFVLPPKRTPTEFADESRRLPDGKRWRTDPLTPYLRGIMDAFDDPEVERLTIKKSTQVGGTESLLNMIRYGVGHKKQSVLVVQPTKDLAADFGSERVMPMVKRCPVLRTMRTRRVWDLKRRKIALRGPSIYLVGAESPAELGSRSLPFVLWDETDEYPARAGKRGSAITLGWERTRKFRGMRKGVSNSTPTRRHGHIHVQWEASLKHRFHVPCPHCGAWQHLIRKRIHWEHGSSPEEVESDQSAWYECAECRARIEETEKGPMVSRGVWIPEGGELPPKWKETKRGRSTRKKGTKREPRSSGIKGSDGFANLEGVLPGSIFRKGKIRPSRHWGFHLNALYSGWLTFSDIAAQFLRCCKDPIALEEFTNKWEGEIWEETIESVKGADLRRLVEVDWKMESIPNGVQILTAAIDVQAGHFWALVEGWGYNEESWTVFFGRLASWGEVETLLNRTWPGGMQVELAAIDSGSWSQDVYDFCAKNPSLYLPIKGSRGLRGPMFRGYPAEVDPDTGKPERNGLLLWICDTTRIKDRLTTRLRQTSPRLVHFPGDVPEDLIQHILGEHKVMDRNEQVWKQVTPGAPNHGWDCMVYAYMAMRVLKQHLAIPTAASPPAGVGPPPRQRERARGWVRGKKGWIN